MRRWRVEHCSYVVCSLALCTLLWLVVLQTASRSSAANVAPGARHRHYWWYSGDVSNGDEDVSHIKLRLTFRACLGILGSFLAAALSNAAGIGGGAFFVPLYNIVVGFGLKTSTGLSQAAIVGGSLAGMVFNLCMHHPWDPTRPLVDLDVALVLTPALLLGVSSGVILNDLLPDWLITLLLVSLLLVMARRTFLRGCTTWVEETQHMANVKAAAAIGSSPMPLLPPICTDHVPSSVCPTQDVVLQPADSSDEEDEEEEQQDEGKATNTPAPAAAAGGQAPAAGPQQVQLPQDGQQQQQPPAAAGAGVQAPSAQPVAAAAAAVDATTSVAGADQGPAGSLLSRHQQVQAWCQQQQRMTMGPGKGAAASPSSATCHQQQHPQRQQGPEAWVRPVLPASGSQAGLSSSSAAAQAGLHLAGTQPQQRYQFPWVKLCCLVLLWLGFLGLSALDAMLPLCSWHYVGYMVFFVVVTVVVTTVFIRVILVGPAEPSSVPVTASSSRFRRWRKAAEAKSRWGGVGRWLPWGGPVAVAAGGIDLEEGQQQQQQQLVQPLILRPTSSFADIASAASVAGSTVSTLTQSQVAAAAAAVAGAAGVLAGVVGLGGGTMIGPILLEFKIHPQVASATSVVLVFISSSAAALSFSMEGRLVTSYALLFAGAAALGSLSGVTLVAAIVKRTGRPSAVILLLAVCMGAGALLSAVFGGLDVAASIADNDGLQPRSICPSA